METGKVRDARQVIVTQFFSHLDTSVAESNAAH